MKFLDLFAGIGGFRLGMERAGHECVGFCEVDPFARKSYKAIHDTEGEIEFHDIRQVTDQDFRQLRGQVDIICGGFPCQAFSLAGRRLGFEDTRGTLFFEIARAAKQIQPRFLFLENVKGLLSHDKGETFRTILTTLDELGYDVEWQVFNSKNFGVPQNRERVFIIGQLRGAGGRQIFPFRGESAKSDFEPRIEVVGSTQGEDSHNFGQREIVYSPNGVMGCLTATDYKGPKQVAIPVLTPDREEKRQNGCRFKTDLTGEEQCVVTPNLRIRKLTPRECWRLQGFPDWAFDKAQEVNSNSQLYKQAGNSVTVNVIEAIAIKLEEIDGQKHN